MFYHAKQSTLKLNDFECDYIRFGTGAKTLIMIQGLNTNGIQGSAFMLAFMYRMFAKEYTVYVFDRRKELKEVMSVKQFGDDLSKCMEALNLKDAHVIGVSLGGMIAQSLAIHYPHLVSKLIIALSAAKSNDIIEDVIHRWMDFTHRQQYKELIYDMADKMYSESYLKRYKIFLPLLVKIQTPKDAQRFINMCQTCLTCDTVHDLSKIQCPVYVIGAQKDKIIGVDASQEMIEALKCQGYIYTDLGHAAYEEAKDFNQRMYDFLVS